MKITATQPIPSLAWHLWSSLALFLFTSQVRAQFYAVSDLGTLGGTNAMAYSINNHEQVVGEALNGMGASHAFMFDGGRMMDLGTLGGSNSWAYGINDMGWMVGASELATSHMHAFLSTNGLMNPRMMDLGTLGGTNSAAWMINRHGDIVGWAAVTNGSHHAFFMTNSMLSSMMDLGTATGTGAEAHGINSSRIVVGYTVMPNGSTQPIMTANAMMGSSSMGTMGMGSVGALGGQSWFVNDLGQTAGQAQMPGGSHEAFVSGGRGMMMGGMKVNLGALGGTNSVAYCINNFETVVGTAQLSNGVHHAFMVTNAFGGMVRMMDLNSLIPTNSDWELIEARGINEAGQIVGWGMFAGHTHAFLMTPVSAPVMMVSGPSAQIVGPGAMVSLQMQMSASEPLTYQWMHDGVPVPGATNSALTIPGMEMGMAGQYTVAVRNSMGTVGNSSVPVSLFSMMLTKGTPHVTVAAPAGSRFRIDYSDLAAPHPTWQTMTNFTMMGATTQVSVLPQPGSQAGFYRAVMMP